MADYTNDLQAIADSAEADLVAVPVEKLRWLTSRAQTSLPPDVDQADRQRMQDLARGAENASGKSEPVIQLDDLQFLLGLVA